MCLISLKATGSAYSLMIYCLTYFALIMLFNDTMVM
jgi:hypothetical protein